MYSHALSLNAPQFGEEVRFTGTEKKALAVTVPALTRIWIYGVCGMKKKDGKIVLETFSTVTVKAESKQNL